MLRGVLSIKPNEIGAPACPKPTAAPQTWLRPTCPSRSSPTTARRRCRSSATARRSWSTSARAPRPAAAALEADDARDDEAQRRPRPRVDGDALRVDALVFCQSRVALAQQGGVAVEVGHRFLSQRFLSQWFAGLWSLLSALFVAVVCRRMCAGFQAALSAAYRADGATNSTKKCGSIGGHRGIMNQCRSVAAACSGRWHERSPAWAGQSSPAC